MEGTPPHVDHDVSSPEVHRGHTKRIQVVSGYRKAMGAGAGVGAAQHLFQGRDLAL